jgi:hypothetical protein
MILFFVLCSFWVDVAPQILCLFGDYIKLTCISAHASRHLGLGFFPAPPGNKNRASQDAQATYNAPQWRWLLA